MKQRVPALIDCDQARWRSVNRETKSVTSILNQQQSLWDGGLAEHMVSCGSVE